MPTLGFQDKKRKHRIQSVLVSKDKFTLLQAKQIVRNMGFNDAHYDVGGATGSEYYRFRQVDPVKGWKKRTIPFSDGVKAIYEFAR